MGMFSDNVGLVLFVGFLSEALTKVAGMNTNTIEDESIKGIITSNLQVWVFIIPGISEAIGANLISEFLLRKKPNSKDGK